MSGWALFAGSALLIALAGPVLTRSADRIATALRLSRSWIGVALLSTATSLPELVTGFSASGIVGDADLAVGDALGSTLFNLALIALLDLLSREDSLFRRVEQGHVLTAALGVLLLAAAGAPLLLAHGPFHPRIGHVSLFSPVLLILYLAAIHAVFRHERPVALSREVSVAVEAPRRDIARYLFAAVAVASAGTMLPFAGEQIAGDMGWDRSFVGTVLLAAATSLPELVVVIAALRANAVDLGVATLLGSNLFDIAVLSLDDVAYRPGSLFAAADTAHAGTVFAATMMSAIVIIAILNRPRYRVFGWLGWSSIALAGLYFGATWLLLLVGAHNG
ncbi:MAG: cation transporter [Sphingomonas sp.]|nr:cation transporter [Sphingomonas sp.]